jgi:hypothetical protein
MASKKTRARAKDSTFNQENSYGCPDELHVKLPGNKSHEKIFLAR